MTVISDLVAAIKTRLGSSSPRLIQLTNYDPTALTVDDTVLAAAAQDAVGDFQIRTGITADATNYSHLTALYSGTLYYLEYYKGRDSGIMDQHARDFYSKLKAFEAKKYPLAQSNSVLTPSTEKTGARPDMDRRNTAFSGGRSMYYRPREVENES